MDLGSTPDERLNLLKFGSKFSHKGAFPYYVIYRGGGVVGRKSYEILLRGRGVGGWSGENLT